MKLIIEVLLDLLLFELHNTHLLLESLVLLLRLQLLLHCHIKELLGKGTTHSARRHCMQGLDVVLFILQLVIQ